MCGRMVVFTYDEVVGIVQAMRAGADNPYPDWPARRQAPEDALPRMPVPVVLPGPHGAGDFDVRVLNWGYPVEWREWPVYNTRIESLVRGDGFWRKSIANRCLVPTRGFYERHGSEAVRNPKTGGKVKRPYRFSLVDEGVTWLGAVREDDCFSVVTTEPNGFVAPVHDRMPLVLRRAELPIWMGDGWRSLADRADVPLDVRPEDLADDGQMRLF